MRRLFERTLRGIIHTPGLFITTSAAVAMSLVLAGAFVLALMHLGAWASALVGTETLVAYLRPDVDGVRAQEIARTVGALAGVQKVEVESPAEAAQRLRVLLGSNDDHVIEAALTWSLAVSAGEAGQLPALAVEVRKISGVDEVDYGESVYARLQAVERVAVGFGVALLVLVVSVCAFVVNIAVSLALFVRRDEIAVQRIVGASDGFVLAPLIVEGSLSGLLGGAVALGTLYALFAAFVSRYAAAIVSLGASPPRFFDFTRAALLVVAGVVIACAGAMVASVRYLRQAE